MKKIIRLLNLNDESGSALVIVAISLVALLGFTALVIDGGRLYVEKSKLQNALDAAVLAGAQGLKKSETQAITNAKDVAAKNGFSITESNLTITGDSIKATKLVNVPLTFARVIGKNDTDVKATAKAIVGHVRMAKGVAPIAVEESHIPNGKELTCFEKNKGNCGFLALDGRGASSLEEAIRNGSVYTVGETVLTEPGVTWGPTSKAINDLIASDASKPQCQDPKTADNQCNRVINIVVIDTWDGANGRDELNVTGFASYWLEGFDDKTLKGQFLTRLQPGEISDTGVGTLYSVKLVE
ncbi:Tad domain-containing protein [Neobacillus sp. PS2-9]|uniref:TadE/TadG family type IV pilus assembly protein n=1 Tax=Neobacillus sp. PS2-9 TaxID=3070676 RepID=UPI0027DF62DC|nr:Tad domain-containing protein [Neobacillus sp. PS2-9]WML59146.1 Tad domain-containing protein [Neobacillus sp. PS2-9]